jgi:hypothetical protein
MMEPPIKNYFALRLGRRHHPPLIEQRPSLLRAFVIKNGVNVFFQEAFERHEQEFSLK